MIIIFRTFKSITKNEYYFFKIEKAYMSSQDIKFYYQKLLYKGSPIISFTKGVHLLVGRHFLSDQLIVSIQITANDDTWLLFPLEHERYTSLIHMFRLIGQTLTCQDIFFDAGRKYYTYCMSNCVQIDIYIRITLLLWNHYSCIFIKRVDYIAYYTP